MKAVVSDDWLRYITITLMIAGRRAGWLRSPEYRETAMRELLQKVLDWLAEPRESEPLPIEPDIPGVSPPRHWISLEQFRRASGLPAVRAQDWHPHLLSACVEFEIVGPVRIAAFLAQVGHESGGFVHTREIWGPTPAQQRYEGRADLGNTNIGDGSRFRGRGLIQITGRHNYTAVARGLAIDCVNQPELLEQPRNAARSAAWWWANNGCNEIADTGDFTRLTRRINGGINGLDDRLQRWEAAKGALA